MGILCTLDPAWSPITENGEFRKISKDKQDTYTVTHPNVRGCWSVRGGSMFIVTAGALLFGTRESYIIAMAAATWREGYDCIDLLKYSRDGKKIVLKCWKSPLGPQPPLLSFLFLNVLALIWILMS